MARCEVSGLSEAELRAALAEVRSAQRSLDGVVMRIAARAAGIITGSTKADGAYDYCRTERLRSIDRTDGFTPWFRPR